MYVLPMERERKKKKRKGRVSETVSELRRLYKPSSVHLVSQERSASERGKRSF